MSEIDEACHELVEWSRRRENRSGVHSSVHEQRKRSVDAEIGDCSHSALGISQLEADRREFWDVSKVRWFRLLG